MRKTNFLVIFDISNDKHRKKVVKILEKYGYRIQYSAFECSFTIKSKNTAVREISMLTESTDSVRLYKLPESVYVVNKGEEFFNYPSELLFI